MKKNVKGLSLLIGSSLLMSSLTGCGSGHSATSATYDTQAEAPTSSANYAYEATESAQEPMYSAEASDSGRGKYSAGTNNMTTVSGYSTEDYCDDSVIENNESYTKPEENGFCLVLNQPLSTFAADVDTASYSNIRRMIEDGYSIGNIDPDAVRAEEFINYFKYDLYEPEKGDLLGITTEVSTCPWNTDNQLMFVGMKTGEIDFEEAPVNNLVFLIDVSGSMNSKNKLPLLQKTFDELVDNLPDEGTISIVTYSGEEKVVLEGESMRNKKAIKKAIDKLHASGCTNGQAGMQRAYEIAQRYYVEGGNNRVIMATDGDLNVGISSLDDLEAFISDKKDEGVFLSILGFGEGNYKDDKMETLADCGNGNYSYIDSLAEGKKVLVDEMSSTLYTVAKDVKLQVEFNPANVNAYRLIGYENRLMDDQDFNDDTKDGGEIGAGHSVVALYEIIPARSPKAIELKYQDNKVSDSKEKVPYSHEFATVSVRYKDPDADKSELFSIVVGDEVVTENPSDDFKFASSVAEFAMILEDNENKGTASLEDIMKTYKQLEDTDEYQDEFYYLVRTLSKRS